jgi:hypothetical protein
VCSSKAGGRVGKRILGDLSVWKAIDTLGKCQPSLTHPLKDPTTGEAVACALEKAKGEDVKICDCASTLSNLEVE